MTTDDDKMRCVSNMENRLWLQKYKNTQIPSCLTTRSDKLTCSVRCVTCASSSFSPFAGVGVTTGIFLAEEGLDVGVEDLGVVELDLDAPAANRKKKVGIRIFNFILSRQP